MNIPGKPWTSSSPPKRILVIRLQAMGDVVITLPYLQHLRHSLPSSTKFDFLTRTETKDIPKSVHLFDKVYSIGGGRNHKRQLISTFLLLPTLVMRRYDVVIDLQNTLVSKIVRRSISPKAWVEFDKYSPIAAGERNRITIEATGLGNISMNSQFKLKDPLKGESILRKKGWSEKDTLVVLNPAGFFETRNWAVHNYVRFSELWLQRYPQTKFLMLGTSAVAEKADFLSQHLGERFINLVGQTSPSEAFAVLQHSSLVLSEDSGLMHMAWVSGIPTLTLFGSTRSDWSRPLGKRSFFFDSSDLPCGNCMGSVCRMGDIRCLARISPEVVIENAFKLVEK
ncbi:MAG TPA: glycosyltransferase family 9 protein [Flavitalea sp.]|nr:glycosyltransferase family 9 protein [Flavitalea sp.]